MSSRSGRKRALVAAVVLLNAGILLYGAVVNKALLSALSVAVLVTVAGVVAYVLSEYFGGSGKNEGRNSRT